MIVYEINANTSSVTQVMIMTEIILRNSSNYTVNYNNEYKYQVLNFNFYCYD